MLISALIRLHLVLIAAAAVGRKLQAISSQDTEKGGE